MNDGELSLEKLKIHERLVHIEKSISDDKEDTKSFRKELKDMMTTQHTVLFGDGESRKGLITRTTELETAHQNHAKLAWTGITVAMGLAITSFWNLLTSKGH